MTTVLMLSMLFPPNMATPTSSGTLSVTVTATKRESRVFNGFRFDWTESTVNETIFKEKRRV